MTLLCRMYDVVVICAGLSGLQVAHSYQHAGLSTIVIEVQDGVGGKVWSVPLASKSGVAGLGAAWINDTLQKRIWAYIKLFGLQVVTQRLEGNAVMQTETGYRIVYYFGITPEVSEWSVFPCVASSGMISRPKPGTHMLLFDPVSTRRKEEHGDCT